ncbi:MAG: orotidine 5'-phosphate decarboxylase / HUMPS family protein, partial [Bryobacteraceae bacterium]
MNPLIVALDFQCAEDARELVTRLGGRISFYKVGLELFTSAG